MEEAFQLFDNRGDNKIHISHIGNALRALGQNPTESDVKKFAQQHKAGIVLMLCTIVIFINIIVFYNYRYY
jgi:Ca2+-binding EF-hand superfamily protein